MRAVWEAIWTVLTAWVGWALITTAPKDYIGIVIIAKHKELEISKVDIMTDHDPSITFGTMREVTLLMAANLDARREAGGADRSSNEVRLGPGLGSVG